MKSLKSHLNNEDGSGLILALMTLMVLSVLGLSLGAITIGSHRLSSVNRDTTSAYYIAEAGVNQAYEEIESIVLSAYEGSSTQDSFFDKIDGSADKYIDGASVGDFGEQFGDSPKATVHLTKENGDSENIISYTLISEGSVDNKSRVVEKKFEVTWVDKDTGNNLPFFPQNAALISRSKIDMTGSAGIFGDVHIDSTENNSIVFDGNAGVKNGTIFYHPSADSNNLIKMPSYYNPAEYPLRKRNDPLPWVDYRQFIENYKAKPDYKSKINSNNFESLADFRYVHTPYNSHMVIQNNNINLSTWMIKSYDLDLNKDTKINDIVVGDRSTLNIETTRNTKINNIVINSSDLNLKAKENSNSIEINNLTLNSSNITIETGDRDIDIHLNNITINNNRIRFIGSGNVNIFVENSLKLNNGTIELDGSGKFEFLVDEYHHNNGQLKIQNVSKVDMNILSEFVFSSGTINNSASAKSSNLNINYFGTEKLSIGGAVFMMGNLYINQADLILKGSGNVQGLVLSKGSTVDIDGGSINNSLILAPFASMDITGSGTVNGVVVADKINMSGGTRIQYNDYYLSDLPSDSSGTVTDPSISPSRENIIQSEPIVEPQ